MPQTGFRRGGPCDHGHRWRARTTRDGRAPERRRGPAVNVGRRRIATASRGEEGRRWWADRHDPDRTDGAARGTAWKKRPKISRRGSPSSGRTPGRPRATAHHQPGVVGLALGCQLHLDHSGRLAAVLGWLRRRGRCALPGRIDTSLADAPNCDHSDIVIYRLRSALLNSACDEMLDHFIRTGCRIN